MEENIEKRSNEANDSKTTSDEFLTSKDLLEFAKGNKSILKTILLGWAIAYNISLLLYIAIYLALYDSANIFKETGWVSLFFLTIIPGAVIGLVINYIKK